MEVATFWNVFDQICTSFQQLIFLDESWRNDRSNNRYYGRSPKGERCYNMVSFLRGIKLNILLSCNYTGVIEYQLYKNNINRETFNDFMWSILSNHIGQYPIEKNCIILMDNAQWHNQYDLDVFMDAFECVVIYLPAYYPMLNLTEYMFQALKAKTRGTPLVTSYDEACNSCMDLLDELIGIDLRSLLLQLGFLNPNTVTHI